MNPPIKSKETTIDGINVTSISPTSTRDYMDILHSYAEDVIRFYTETVGLYPHKYLKIIPGSKDCDGGYPVETGVIAIHRIETFNHKPESCWKWIVAHEIAHMYFGYYVLEKDREPDSKLGWITKGLGLYLDSLFMRDIVDCLKYHQEYIQKFLDAKKKGVNTSFFLRPDEIAQLNFDYNDVVMHGRAYCVISEIEKIVGPKKFKKIVIGLIKDFENREIGFDEFVTYIKTYVSVDFAYEVD